MSSQMEASIQVVCMRPSGCRSKVVGQLAHFLETKCGPPSGCRSNVAGQLAHFLETKCGPKSSLHCHKLTSLSQLNVAAWCVASTVLCRLLYTWVRTGRLCVGDPKKCFWLWSDRDSVKVSLLSLSGITGCWVTAPPPPAGGGSKKKKNCDEKEM